jgi:hypothetical protein
MRQRSSPLIDIHLRISRRFVFWFIVASVALFALWLLMTGLTGGSGGVDIGPIQNKPQP